MALGAYQAAGGRQRGGERELPGILRKVLSL